MTYIMGLVPPGGGLVMGKCYTCGFHIPMLGRAWEKHIEQHERVARRRRLQLRRERTGRAVMKQLRRLENLFAAAYR